ncbi:mitoferrin-like protein [Tribonema minus]|uniref:Mitoferrin-like protein n=1 Tax=Tribonema minus TaxID=303371 RepID=A0A835Z185_9STRA|nr:mitoferrin-like protein [Tribonema minus]
MEPAEAAAVADLDWEDWSGEGNFVHHMLAGSIAGVTEHTVMFPVDTLKTHIQCMRECPERQAGSRVLEMVRGQGMLRLWRGVGTMFVGCVPAHAAYFSILELCKERFGANGGGHAPVAAAAAGVFATVFHDAVMTPMDVIKQRLQLGYYRGIGDCVRTIARAEGVGALYRSFPTTLFMNIPYGAIMVAANESLKTALRPRGDHTTATYMLAGCGAGAVAAAATTPLDVVKTMLQTQAIHAHATRYAAAAAAPHVAAPAAAAAPIFAGTALASSGLLRRACAAPAGATVALMPAVFHSNAAARCIQGCGEKPEVKLQYRGFVDAAREIRAVQGWSGLFRGVVPRLMVHAPSVAISWTTYETAKRWLQDT